MPFFPGAGLPGYYSLGLYIGGDGLKPVLGALIAISLGLVAYMVKARLRREWPFEGDGGTFPFSTQ